MPERASHSDQSAFRVHCGANVTPAKVRVECHPQPYVLSCVLQVCRPLYAAIVHALSSDARGSDGSNGGNGGNSGGNDGGGNGGGGNSKAGDVLESASMAAGRLARLDANVREWSAQVHLESD